MVRLVERSSRLLEPLLPRGLDGYLASRQLQLCELHAILHAFSLICQRGVNDIVICFSKHVLQCLSAVKPTRLVTLLQILSFLTFMTVRGLCAKFIWITSHVGLCHNSTDERLAKEVCHQPHRGDGRHVTSPGSAPLFSCVCNTTEMQRGPLALPSTTTSPSAATNARTVAGV